MTEVTTPHKDDLAAVDELYRRLSARDAGRPGEGVRRKVQAYAAQQTAERALRDGNKVTSKAGADKPAPIAPAASASTAAPASAPKATPRSTAAAVQPEAAKKPLG